MIGLRDIQAFFPLDLTAFKEIVNLTKDSGFILVFAIYSLFRHDRTLSRLCEAIRDLTDQVTRDD